MSFIKITLDINEYTKVYKGWYYNKVGDKYYIFNPESKIVYTRFTVKDCKTCIDKIIEGGN